MRESKVEAAVTRWAGKNDIRTSKRSGPNDRGFPDREFRRRGRVIYMEMKATGEAPTALQHKRLRELRADGFTAVWFDNPHGAIEFLREELLEEFEI